MANILVPIDHFRPHGRHMGRFSLSIDTYLVDICAYLVMYIMFVLAVWGKVNVDGLHVFQQKTIAI